MKVRVTSAISGTVKPLRELSLHFFATNQFRKVSAFAFVLCFLQIFSGISCNSKSESSNQGIVSLTPIKPVVVTGEVEQDSDDPAIWLHPTDLNKSLILGTDKAGILFVFDLNGKIVNRYHEAGMRRLNNIDIEYGMIVGGKETDIAVATDRDAGKLHVFGLPDLQRLDNGGFEPFSGEQERRPMGIGLYKRPSDSKIFAIVSRKSGPSGSYLWQYGLDDNGQGKIRFTEVRRFGKFSGVNEQGEGEIEAIAVDDELGFVYYADELFGIRKYQADPDANDADMELAVFGTDGFANDREGISIYKQASGRGYIIVSDQGANRFHVFRRQGTANDPHHHELVKIVHTSAIASDGSEVSNLNFGAKYPDGIFIAMADDKTFQYYSWRDFVGKDFATSH